MGERVEKKLHVLIYPWLAFGHLTPFLHLANELAERGHQISFFLPPKALPKLALLNRRPELISFFPISVPAVDGLPVTAQTTADTPIRAGHLLFEAFDLTRPAIESFLSQLRPDFVLYDLAYWLPGLARKYGAKPIFYSMFCISFFAYLSPRARGLQPEIPMSEPDFMRAPPGFPSSPGFRLRTHEARQDAWLNGFRVGLERIPFWEMFYRAIEESHAVCCRSCREMEGPFGDYFVEHYQKPLLWAGPLLPKPSASGGLDEHWTGWLNGFQAGSVVYCAFGSEVVLRKQHFQELLLGLELTGLPFLAVLKPPLDCESVESALPQGFSERVKERGVIHDGWVPQPLILKHPSVGCFVNHCGAGTLLEALTSSCKLVLLPQKVDNYNNARLMSTELRVGLEVERREDDGSFTKENVSDAIMALMKGESEVVREITANHAKWREFLLGKQLQETYMNQLIVNLQAL